MYSLILGQQITLPTSSLQLLYRTVSFLDHILDNY